MSVKSWFASLRSSTRRPVTRSRPHASLGVEALEDRTLLSSFLVISSAGAFPAFNLVSPAGSGAFGTQVVRLSTGNVVVTDPAANNNEGAVYLFNGQSGLLFGALRGTTSGSAGDQVGSGGVTALSNGNFVVDSPYWNGGSINGMGAVTWVDGTTGIIDVVSPTNSLVGSAAGDRVGLGVSDPIFGNFGGVTALSNGNYVVDSPEWNSQTGAATWGDGTAGIVGTISNTNSLVGATAGDHLGGRTAAVNQNFSCVTALNNGNYVVVSPDWSTGMGAATWGNGTVGISGAVSNINSLVGSTTNDNVGFGGAAALNNGNYVVASPNWTSFAGAATWGDGTIGVTGAVSPANSLVGSLPFDQVSSFGVTPLANGNYVVNSPAFTSHTGAATFGSGTTPITGIVSAINSLVGTSPGDAVGSGGVAALSNGNYVVASPAWNGQAGAATLGNGTAGITGTISNTNSLVGANSSDQVGLAGVTPLANGNYVVVSPDWSGGSNGLGAATWGSGTTGVTGNISSANSLVGSTAGDLVGSGGVTALTSGDYVVDSPAWNGGTINGMGAATPGNGATGTSGTIAAANSLVGSAAGDHVGSGGVTALTNGAYVVDSPAWNGGATLGLGAATFGAIGAAGTGTISAANSLIGSATGDLVGSGGVTGLGNGQYVVASPAWNGNTGAATWVSGTGATLDGQNTVDAQNSIEGPAAGATANPITAGPGAFAGSFFVAVPASNGGQVTIGLPDPNLLQSNTDSGQTLTVTPGFVQNPLAAGTDVILQASATITVTNPIVVPAGGVAGDLTLDAPSVQLDAGINTAGGALTLGGTVNPGGANTAIIALNASPITFKSGSSLAVNFNGTTAGTGYDQLQVTGAIDLSNATLSVINAGGFAGGQAFVILQSTTALNTIFVGQPEGSTITGNGQTFKISYLNDAVTLTVLEPLQITTTTLASYWTANTPGYSQTIATSGGTAPITFSVSAGALPAGLGLDANTGVISGTPTTAGTSTFTITATDSSSQTFDQSYTIVIVPPQFVYDPNAQTLIITLTPSLPTFTFAQQSQNGGTANGNGLPVVPITYTFTLSGSNGSVTQAFPGTLLTTAPAAGQASVKVIGQGLAGNAVLITNDIFTGTVGGVTRTFETPETVSLGSNANAGVGTLLKYLGNSTSNAAYTFLTLSNFPLSYAYAGRADGTVTLYGSSGTQYNGFVSAGNYAYVGGPTLFHLAQGAPYVYGYSAGQSTDFAYHYTALPGSSYVVSGTAYSYMSCSDTVNGTTQTYFNVGVGFLLNTGVSNNPGKDYAYIIDSPGNDTFVGGTPYSYLYMGNASGAFTEFDAAYGFALIYAQSFVGGTDTATNLNPNKNILGGNWRVS